MKNLLLILGVLCLAWGAVADLDINSGKLIFPDDSEQTTAFKADEVKGTHTYFIKSGDVTGLRDAITDINFRSPSSSNRFLIKLEPGIYNLGNTGIVLPLYTRLEGSGLDMTTLKSESATNTIQTNGVNELADINIECEYLSDTETSLVYAIDVQNGSLLMDMIGLNVSTRNVSITLGINAIGNIYMRTGAIKVTSDETITNAVDNVYGVYVGGLAHVELDNLTMNIYAVDADKGVGFNLDGKATFNDSWVSTIQSSIVNIAVEMSGSSAYLIGRSSSFFASGAEGSAGVYSTNAIGGIQLRECQVSANPSIDIDSTSSGKIVKSELSVAPSSTSGSDILVIDCYNGSISLTYGGNY